MDGSYATSYILRADYVSPNGVTSATSAPSVIDSDVQYQFYPTEAELIRHTEIIVNKATGEITSLAKTVDGVSDTSQAALATAQTNSTLITQLAEGITAAVSTSGGANLILGTAGRTGLEDWGLSEDGYAVRCVSETDPGEALSKALWFYSCGRETLRAGSQGDSVQAYSFDDDDNLIYAAFLDQYGVDLSDIPYLHWWKFQAMFENLRPDHKFCQVMHYRTAKIDRKWPKAQRDFYADMKKRYAIRGAEKEKITLAERDKQWKDYIKHRLGGGTNV